MALSDISQGLAPTGCLPRPVSLTLTSGVPSGIHEDGLESETAGRLTLCFPPDCTKLSICRAPLLTRREAGRTGLIVSTQQQGHAHAQGPLLHRGSGSWCSHPTPVLLPSCFRDEYPSHPEEDVELRKISVLLGLDTSSHSANAWWVGVLAGVHQRTRLGACPRAAHSQANRTPEGRRLLGHLAQSYSESCRIGLDFRSCLPMELCQQSK